MSNLKILEFRVQNFRNIDDSGWIPLERVTAFVGRNESGKTALLKALHKFNQERIEAAQRICASCPVKRQCLENATTSDLHWSVRGGLVPKRHELRGGKKAAPSFDPTPWLPAWECKEHGSMSIRYRDADKSSGAGKGNRRPYCGECNDLRRGRRGRLGE